MNRKELRIFRQLPIGQSTIYNEEGNAKVPFREEYLVLEDRQQLQEQQASARDNAG